MDKITVLFKRFQTAGLLSVAALTMLAVSPASASPVNTYNDAATFLADVQSNYFLENFNSHGTGLLSGSLSLSGNGYHYSVDAPGDALYMINTPSGSSNQAISTASPNINLVFTFDSGINAVGGSFFATNDPGDVVAGHIKIILNDGTSQTLTNPTAASFTGFISPGADISSITVGATTPAGIFATVDNLYVGRATVPEPSSVFLLIGGLGACAFRLRRRKA